MSSSFIVRPNSSSNNFFKLWSEFKNLPEIGLIRLDGIADGSKYFDDNGILGSIGKIPVDENPDFKLSIVETILSAVENESMTCFLKSFIEIFWL